MSLSTVRTAIAAAINGMDGLRCSADGFLKDAVNPPEAVIDLEVLYDHTFGRGSDSVLFTVKVIDRRVSERAAQTRIDTWRDPDPTNTGSIKYVLENNAGIQAACDYLRVRRAGPLQLEEWVDGMQYLTVDFEAEVVI